MTTETPFFSFEELVALAEKARDHRGAEYVYPTNDAVRAGTAVFGWGEDIGDHGDEVTLDGLSCIYMFCDDQPGCMVGEMLYTAGVLNEIPRWNEETGTGDIVSIITPDGAVHKASHDLIRTDQKGACYLRELQQFQDQGFPWGEAYAMAIKNTDDKFPQETS